MDIYIHCNEKGLVFEIIVPHKISDESGYYKKIGETDDPNFARQYVIFDELGVPNYKYLGGEIVKRTDEEKAAERKARQDALLQKRYIPSINESVNTFVQSMILKESASFDVDMKIKTAGVYDKWAAGKYEVGDIRVHAGQVWECWTAHDNAIYPDINPDNPQTWANFWRPLHGTSKETARPWVKPQYGTTDMYHAGEYMVYTDGNTYECVSDTVYSLDEYAQAWRVVGEASEPDGGEGGESDGEEDVQEPSTEEYPAWVQPTGAHDAYAQGAKVSHNGKKWTSDIANNVWEPGVYGWTEVQ